MTSRQPGDGAHGESAAFQRGYAAAVEELRATADHWSAHGVPRAGVAMIRELAATLEEGWRCYELGHTAERCLARRAQDTQAREEEAGRE